jgi:hypothetical protein
MQEKRKAGRQRHRHVVDAGCAGVAYAHSPRADIEGVGLTALAPSREDKWPVKPI